MNLHKLLNIKNIAKLSRQLHRPKKRVITAFAVLLLGLSGVQMSHAAGLLTPVGSQQSLDIAEHHVNVILENGYSITSVEQVFKNSNSTDQHARYSFPVPKDAAVGEFTYWIDGQPVHAEVLKKDDARQLHESEKQQGRETALVEKNKQQTFEVEVSPIRAHQSVRIRLVYLQKLIVDHSMGRYLYPLEDGGVDENANTFWTRNETVSEKFSFNVKLRSSYPVDAVRVPNGLANITQLDAGIWEISISKKNGSGAYTGNGLNNDDIKANTDLHAETEEYTTDSAAQNNENTSNNTNSAAYSLNNDIVVYWRLAENLPGSVDLLSYRAPNSNEGTFMLTLTPGIDLNPITEGRDWVFVLDTSGSMQGKFRSLTDGVRKALKNLNSADRFKIIAFNNNASALTRGFVQADSTKIESTLRKLDTLNAKGGTNMYAGISAALKSIDQDRTTSIMLVTDGVANVGPVHLSQFLKLMEKSDVRLFTAIMGNGANEILLEGLTKHMEGFAMNVSNDDEISGLMMLMTSKVTHEAIHNVRVSIDGVRTYDLTPDKFSRVYRGEQLVMFGQYQGDGTATVTIDAEISGQKQRYSSKLLFPQNDTTNPELERLWAFAKIKALQTEQEILGETEDTKTGITELALANGLVTDYTSLVVVRDEVFKERGIAQNNAARIEREQNARTTRANNPVQQTTQDANQPAFSSSRHTTSNGGGSFGIGLLLAIGLFGLARTFVHIQDSRKNRS